MPRRFDASIPVAYRPFDSPVYVPDPFDVHDKRDLSMFFVWAGAWLSGQSVDALRNHPQLYRWAPYLPDAARFLSPAEEIARWASYAAVIGDMAADDGDALAVDDCFLYELDRPFAKRLYDAASDRGLADEKGSQAMNALFDELEGWADDWEHSAASLFGKREILEAIFNLPRRLLGSDRYALPCVHPEPHKRLSKRGRPGPKRGVERRASTWGTYLLAWTVGTEALAVRLWNKLLLPPAFRWDSLGKYWKAKQRLVRDLREWHIVPPASSLEPRPPLEPETEDLLEWLVEARTRSVVGSLVRRLTAGYTPNG